MHDERQDRVAIGQRKRRHAQERPAREIERRVCIFFDQASRVRFRGCPQRAHGDRQRLMHALCRLSFV
jgi:hypothetical protein